MELHIIPEFEAVFFINGAFFENAANLKYDEHMPVYITVHPLKTELLPYTLKVLGAAPLNHPLYKGYRLNSGHYYLKLLPRFNHIYAPANLTQNTKVTNNIIFKLFNSVKNQNFKSAMELLTQGLKQTIDEPALKDFFSGYEDIILNDGFLKTENLSAFMINSAGNSDLYEFKIIDSLIDDIIAVE